MRKNLHPPRPSCSQRRPWDADHSLFCSKNILVQFRCGWSLSKEIRSDEGKTFKALGLQEAALYTPRDKSINSQNDWKKEFTSHEALPALIKQPCLTEGMTTVWQHDYFAWGHIERMNWTYLFQVLYNHVSFKELTIHDTPIHLSQML